jgi:hypothetical protein
LPLGSSGCSWGGQDQSNCDKMVQHVLVELLLCLSLDHHHLKNRKCVNPQLEKKVNLKFCSFFLWPIRVILVYLWALSTAFNHRRKPVFLP